MTRKERIQQLLKHKETDIVPFHADLTLKIRDKLAAYYNLGKDQVEEYVGNHFLYLSYHAPTDTGTEHPKRQKHDSGTITTDGIVLDDRHVVDEFGVVWNNEELYETGDWGMVANPVKNMDLSNYTFPDGSAPGRFEGVEETVKAHPDRYNVLLMTGLFDTAWHVPGIQELLMAMAMEDQSFINTMLDSALEFIVGVLEQVPDYMDGVRFLEDWGVQKGLMMGLHNWKKHLKPRLKIMYETAHKKGLTVISHSCGDNTEIIPELIELGVEISDPAQPETMDLQFLKKEYGKDIIFFGGLGCQSTIPRGTPKDVEKEAKKTLNLMGEGGNYIMGPAGAIPTEAPIENVAALMEFYRNMYNGK